MPFWAYMLHCADRTFYVGQTDDLDVRLWQHENRYFANCYTATRLPAKLVWCGEFPTRYEAIEAERRIKGWGRQKKLALIREDWARIQVLAQNSEKKRASTSSARTELES